jgi:hypothetical protein
MATFQWFVLILIVFGLIKDLMDMVETGQAKYAMGKADGAEVICAFAVRLAQFFVLLLAGAFDKIF